VAKGCELYAWASVSQRMAPGGTSWEIVAFDLVVSGESNRFQQGISISDRASEDM
jgi:hypothetical protein